MVSGGLIQLFAALLEKVLGKKRVYGLHVDTGFMRDSETKKIKTALNKIGFDNLHVYNAEAEFLRALKGITEPEQKRKIIGDLFLDITDRIMKEKGLTGKDWLIGQGTIYPDTIESGGTKNADVIKTHHNRVPRIKQMIAEGKIIEPIRELYKDEARAIGRALGLPYALVDRHPFPGPGLAIRCLCSDGSNEKPTAIVSDPSRRRARQSLTTLKDCFVVSTPRNDSLFHLIKLPIKSVGVQGDERSYANPALVVKEKNRNIKNPSPRRRGQGEVSTSVNPPWSLLQKISPSLTNQNKQINRVLYLLSVDQDNIEKSIVKKSEITRHRLGLLRKIDAIVHKEIEHLPHIWQMPVVLVPFGYKHKNQLYSD